MHHLLCRVAPILFVVGLSPLCVGQDDPFDFPDDNVPLLGKPADAAGQDTEASGEPSELEEPNPLVIQLDERARRGNLPLADAVHALARLGQWSDVNRLLTAVGGRQITVAEMAEMARRIGPAMFVKIEVNEDMSDAALAAATKLQEALKLESETPARLIRAIDELDAAEIDSRLAAARTLLAGGNASIEELVAATVSANPGAPRDDLLRTMLRLGDGGVRALRQLALYAGPDVRQRAVVALVRIDRPGATAELLTALHAADSTPQEVELAQSVFRQAGVTAPSRETSVDWLHRRLQELRSDASLTLNDSSVQAIWKIDDSRTRASYQSTRAILATYRDSVDMAARLLRLGSLPRAVERSVVLADLSYRLMVDPDWGDPEQIQAVREALGPALTAEDLSATLAQAMADEDIPALVGLVRLVDPQASAFDRNLLLRGSGPEPTPLVQAASFHDPRVRYEAALVTAALAGSLPYAGSSRVKYCLAEMKSLGELPKAILVETRSEVIIQQETLLDQLGLDSEVVSSVAGLQRAVARGGDLRLILSKTELADMRALEMVDVVRRTDRGRNVPLVFYGADVLGLDSNRWSAPAVQVDRPASTAAFSQTLRTVERRRRLPPLAPIDRRIYRDSASDLLASMQSTP
jgi:hypothetical protein